MDLQVFISSKEAECTECGEKLGRHAWITLVEEKGPVCLACADLDHLVFLPAGDAALSRRSRKHSTLSAVVLQWSRQRKRYERQGLLVESQALEKAEQECLADSDMRAARRAREAERREVLDQQYIENFSRQVKALFPYCPEGSEVAIAEHACQKYSGRVGRSAAAKSFDEEAVTLAVVAHIRHSHTRYDELLAAGLPRGEARSEIKSEISEVLNQWRTGNKEI
jgi:hypothetical protein